MASKQGDKIGLDFPAEQSVLDAPLVTDGAKFDSLVKALAAAAPGVEKHIVAAGWSGWGPTVELDTQVDLKGLKVDVSHFVSDSHYDCDGSSTGGSPAFEQSQTADISSSMVILTQPAPAESDNDVYSRVFAPAVGVDEDPVVRLPRLRRAETCAMLTWFPMIDWSRSHYSRAVLAWFRCSQATSLPGICLCGDEPTEGTPGQPSRRQHRCHMAQGDWTHRSCRSRSHHHGRRGHQACEESGWRGN